MKRASIAFLIMVMIPAMILANGPRGQFQERELKKVGREMPRLKEKLQLTEEQREQTHDLHLKYQKKRIPLQSELKLAQIELEELIRDEAGDRNIESQINKVNKLRADLYALRVRERVERGNIMTPEQKKILREFGQDRRMHRDMRHRHPMRPGMQGPRLMPDGPEPPIDEPIERIPE